MNIIESAYKKMTNAQRQKKFRAVHKDTYGRDRYLHRRFVPVDGEGVTVRTGKRKGEHDYVLLAVKGCPPLYDKNGLRSSEILSYLWRNLDNKNINVIYGGSYDFNSWLASFSKWEVQDLYDGKAVSYGPYRITWRNRKFFRISRDGKTVTINDVVSFFQQPFIDACDEWLGDWPYRDEIVREKARRAVFTLKDIDAVVDYNEHELELLEMLCNELRQRLEDVHLRPRAWIGPGAVAAALFTRERILSHMTRDTPRDVMHAVKVAYTGGRFECLKWGISTADAYEYDIHSAYPHAMRFLPSLKNSVWGHYNEYVKANFALYHVRWTMHEHNSSIPGPFCVRAKNGTVSYPMSGETWVWSPEMGVGKKYLERYGRLDVLETFVCHTSDERPFTFLRVLYNQRQALKKAKDGAQRALKLAINSAYGKTAQQIGWDRKENKPPRFHQLEWAGWITSYTRAMILNAAMQNPSAIIAFETDALFSLVPLDLPLTDELGDWECTHFTDLTYAQSGMYYATKENGEAVEKTRGIDRGNLSRADVERAMRAGEPLSAPLTRYITAGTALHQTWEKWRTWTTVQKTLALKPNGKRLPLAPYHDGWNLTYCPISPSISREFPLEWEDSDDTSQTFADMRAALHDYDME